jgi:predicted carbohydrate-binding protein with CBM5 and CBM33 domain
MLLPLSLLFVLASQACAHGIIVQPPSRAAGTAYKAACGEQVYNNQASDPYGNVQQLAQIGKNQKDFNASTCNLAMCKGFQASDTNASSVQQFTRGQTVPIKVEIRAPHTGTANVSIVNAQDNTMMGQMMMYWADYASTKTGVQKNQTDFSVTIPSDVPAGSCTQAGQCVVQWWWDSREADQTYMSCVDFVLA